MAGSATTRSFNPNIHGLRGFAALMVFVYHVYLVGLGTQTWPANWPQWLSWIGAVGCYGVELFFMISGYLITETLTRKHSVGQFLIDRSIRLHPAFLGVIVPMFAVGMLFRLEMFADTPPWSWPLHFVSNALFLPGVFELPSILPVAWTLSFELAFYLTAAGAFLIARRGQQPAAFALCIAVGFLLFPRAPGVVFFFIGACLYLYRDRLLGALARLHLPGLCLLLFLALWHIVTEDYHRTRADLSVVFALAILGSAFSGLLLFNSITQGIGWLPAVMRTRVMQFLGTISYSFYLWHAVVMYPVKHGLMARLLPQVGASMTLLIFTVISLIGSVVISWLSYRILEVGVGNWLRKRLARARPTSLSPTAPTG